MVIGMDSFRSWFQGYEQNYAIIGGTACDLLMSEVGNDFRATRDINTIFKFCFLEEVEGRGGRGII